jgi:hypothetical protein
MSQQEYFNLVNAIASDNTLNNLQKKRALTEYMRKLEC